MNYHLTTDGLASVSRIEAQRKQAERELAAVQTKRLRENSHAFHRLWTACVDKPGYRKDDWRAIEEQLKTAGVIQ